MEELVRSVMEQSVHTTHIESVTTGSKADILSFKTQVQYYTTVKAVLM